MEALSVGRSRRRRRRIIIYHQPSYSVIGSKIETPLTGSIRCFALVMMVKYHI
jgi:hypothetical protein